MPLASCLLYISVGWARGGNHERWTLPECYTLGGWGPARSLWVVSLKDGHRGGGVLPNTVEDAENMAQAKRVCLGIIQGSLSGRGGEQYSETYLSLSSACLHPFSPSLQPVSPCHPQLQHFMPIWLLWKQLLCSL